MYRCICFVSVFGCFSLTNFQLNFIKMNRYKCIYVYIYIWMCDIKIGMVYHYLSWFHYYYYYY